MVKYIQTTSSEEQINLIFHSLADPTRRGILERLVHHELSVNEIAEPYDMSLPAISKHLKILEHANLIKKEKRGRNYKIHLELQTLQTAADYIAFYTKFWNHALGHLENFLKTK